MTRYFHGSNEQLEVGYVMKGRGDAYEADWKHTDFYAVLERHRPPEKLAHRDGVFMVADPDDVDLAGGGTEWLFELKPAGRVSRHDVNWSSEISCLLSDGSSEESDAVRQAALNYWTGVPHADESVWEYLVAEAEILRVEPFETFQMSGP
jgi:hypothetical protein